MTCNCGLGDGGGGESILATQSEVIRAIVVEESPCLLHGPWRAPGGGGGKSAAGRGRVCQSGWVRAWSVQSLLSRTCNPR